MKNKVKKHHGIMFYLWFLFCSVIAVTMAALWIMQVFFLTNIYEGMKIREVRKIGDQVAKTFGSGDFEDNLYHQSFQNGFWIRFYDENGMTVNRESNDNFPVDDLPSYRAGGEENINEPPMGRMARRPFDAKEFAQISQKIEESGTNSVVFKEKTEMFNSEAVVYAAKLYDEMGNNYYMHIKAPLEDVGATKNVLQRQLLYVTVMALLFGFLLSGIFATKIAKPISKLTDAAKELAKGEYRVVFPEKGSRETRKLGEVLNHTKDELSKNDELRRDLIANVSHDLRTPLTIIKSYAEMIRDLSGENKVKREEHTNVIIDEADRLSKLVNDILDLSKYEAGAVKLEKSEIDLSTLVENVVDKFKGIKENSDYVFDVYCDKNAVVSADEMKINQVVYNLINNAMNYTGEDKRIIINVRKSGKRVRFSVKDTGAGIEKKEISRVWDRYYRSSKNLDRRGNGIGLAICKNILLAHNADFGIESELKKGSEFWFEI